VTNSTELRPDSHTRAGQLSTRLVRATFFSEYSQNPVSSEYFFPTGFGSIKCISKGVRTDIGSAFPNRKGFTSYISPPRGSDNDPYFDGFEGGAEGFYEEEERPHDKDEDPTPFRVRNENYAVNTGRLKKVTYKD
jgi:hypothetical protein